MKEYIVKLRNIINFKFFAKFKKTIIGIIAIFSFWLFFFHYTDVNQVAICRNIFTGEMYLDSIPGPNLSAPWVQVSRIDIRPKRICIDCDCKNINCVLVSFKPEHWRKFVKIEGFRYYWWSNRMSINFGHSNETRGIDDILRSYAFDKYKHDFIEISSEI